MFSCVGKNVPRKDGAAKVIGEVQYIDDIKILDCWYGAVVRSEIPYGKIKNIKYDPSFDWQKVATCDWRDIPGKNATIFLSEDQRILAQDIVMHVGEAIVLVAAPTKELAQDAKRHVKIEYDELQPVLNIEESKKLKSVIAGEDNILVKYLIEKGDAKKGLLSADHIIEGEYRTGFHEHAYIETQGMAAIHRADGGLTVMGSMQCPFYVLKTLKSIFNVDETKVNVVQTTMGGAFGGKEDYPSLLGTYVALLAKKSGHAVKIVYSRDEDILVTTKRHPSIVTHKTGVKKDGTITAMEIDVAFDGGAYSTMSPVVLSRGLIHSSGPYRCDNVIARAACYATNNVPTGAYRGFGAPQVFFALESHIDKVAEKIGMNPYEFRLKNCVRIGDTLSTTQLLKESVAAERCLKEAASESSFEKKWKSYEKIKASGAKTARTKKGIGLSLYMHGGAFTGSGEAIMKTEAGLRLDAGGKVSVLMGCTDMGQGATTVIPQIAADALGISYERISCVSPDTDIVPDSGPTVASRVTMVIGSVMEKCAIGFKDKLLNFAVAKFSIKKGELKISDDAIFSGNKKIADFSSIADEYLKANGELKIIERYHLPPGINWDATTHRGDAYPAYSWAADVAEVTVDVDTFEVSVDKMTIAVDPGKAVNPILVEGQMEGGTLQALGWGILENAVYDKGRPVNTKFQNYIIPTVMDTPEWKTIIAEEPLSTAPQGAKGIGELPLNGGAPAIANAIYNAIGVRINDLPITPEKLFEAGKNETNDQHK